MSIAENVANKVIFFTKENYNEFDRKLDHYLTSKAFGIPIMILLLGLVFWITISGANIPSELLAKGGFFWIEDKLSDFFFYG